MIPQLYEDISSSAIPAVFKRKVYELLLIILVLLIAIFLSIQTEVIGRERNISVFLVSTKFLIGHRSDLCFYWGLYVLPLSCTQFKLGSNKIFNSPVGFCCEKVSMLDKGQLIFWKTSSLYH